MVKKVLILAPTPFFSDRGCHMHISEQAYALQRQGVVTHIITYPIGRDLPDLKTSRTWALPWYSKRGPGPSWHKFYVDILLLLTARRVAKKFKPDIIHAHLHEGAVIGWALSKLTGVPFVFDQQGSLTGELIAHNFILTKTKWLRSVWYAFERWVDNLSAVVIAQSTEMRRDLVEIFKVPEKNVVMAYDGVNTSQFKPGERDVRLVQSLGIPDDRKVVVYLGGLSPHKGVDILLQAWPQVLKQVPEAYLLLMGYPNEDKYRQKVIDMGLRNDVKVTGKIPYEDAPRYLTLGDIAVAPKRSQTEANGKIYNYMAAGLPTVAFDTVVNRDILGELGVYVTDLNDFSGLAQEIIRLLNNDSQREQLANQVRDKAVRDYSWDGVAKRLIGAYELAGIKK